MTGRTDVCPPAPGANSGRLGDTERPREGAAPTRPTGTAQRRPRPRPPATAAPASPRRCGPLAGTPPPRHPSLLLKRRAPLAPRKGPRRARRGLAAVPPPAERGPRSAAQPTSGSPAGPRGWAEPGAGGTGCPCPAPSARGVGAREPGRPEREPCGGRSAQGPGRAGARGAEGSRGGTRRPAGARAAVRAAGTRTRDPARGRGCGGSRARVRGVPGEGAGGPGRGRGRGAGSRRTAATYLLVRDPLRLLQAEGAAEGAVLGYHAQAAGGAHQLLGVAARGHLGGHDAATALASRPDPRPARSPALPAWRTRAASNRHARPGARANRSPGSAPQRGLQPCGRPPIGREDAAKHAPPPGTIETLDWSVSL